MDGGMNPQRQCERNEFQAKSTVRNITCSKKTISSVPHSTRAISNMQDRLEGHQRLYKYNGHRRDPRSDSKFYQKISASYKTSSRNGKIGSENAYQQYKHCSSHHYQQQQLQSLHTSALVKSAKDKETVALEFLQNLQYLNENPAEFDSIASRFNRIMEGMENNSYILFIAIDKIFDVAVQNSNFRYLGARLISLLHKLNPSPNSFFYLLLTCKLEFQNEQLCKTKQKRQESRIHGIVLFLAELHTLFRAGHSSNNNVAEAVRLTLQELLSIECNRDKLKSICFTLDSPDDLMMVIAKYST